MAASKDSRDCVERAGQAPSFEDQKARLDVVKDLMKEGPEDFFGLVRVLPLVATAGLFRDRPAETRRVTFKRRVECRACGSLGCKACGQVGWTVATDLVTVTVPAGAGIGTKLCIAEKADEHECVSGDLHLEIVEPGARADELTTAARAHEKKLTRSWAKQTKKKRAARRQATLGVVVCVAVLAGSIGVVFVGEAAWLWVTGAGVGATCTQDRDCRSSQCLTLTRPTVFILAEKVGRMCTTTCKVDGDCPGAMRCVGAKHTHSFTNQPGMPLLNVGTPDALVCAP